MENLLTYLELSSSSNLLRDRVTEQAMDAKLLYVSTENFKYKQIITD